MWFVTELDCDTPEISTGRSHKLPKAWTPDMTRDTKIGIMAAVAVVVGVLLLCAASDQRLAYVPQVAQSGQPAPVIVQQSHDGFWEGMMLGHLFSSGPTVVHHYDAPRAYVAPRTTIVNNTTVVNHVAPAPAARPPAPAYVAPRVTSVAGAYSPRPSYSSSYSASRSYSAPSYSSRSYSSSSYSRR
jgi:hypothetical protein